MQVRHPWTGLRHGGRADGALSPVQLLCYSGCHTVRKHGGNLLLNLNMEMGFIVIIVEGNVNYIYIVTTSLCMSTAGQRPLPYYLER